MEREKKLELREEMELHNNIKKSLNNNIYMPVQNEKMTKKEWISMNLYNLWINTLETDAMKLWLFLSAFMYVFFFFYSVLLFLFYFVRLLFTWFYIANFCLVHEMKKTQNVKLFFYKRNTLSFFCKRRCYENLYKIQIRTLAMY